MTDDVEGIWESRAFKLRKAREDKINEFAQEHFRDKRTWWEKHGSQLIIMSMLVALLALGILYAVTNPYVVYECEDRDGVKQAVQNRRGDIEKVVCNDGTIHPYLTRGSRS